MTTTKLEPCPFCGVIGGNGHIVSPMWDGEGNTIPMRPCPDCNTRATARLARLEEVAKEAANLCAHETGTAKERGKTAEGRTVTALIYALKDLAALDKGE